jgi:hypothetical protein
MRGEEVFVLQRFIPAKTLSMSQIGELGTRDEGMTAHLRGSWSLSKDHSRAQIDPRKQYGPKADRYIISLALTGADYVSPFRE